MITSLSYKKAKPGYDFSIFICFHTVLNDNVASVHVSKKIVKGDEFPCLPAFK